MGHLYIVFEENEDEKQNETSSCRHGSGLCWFDAL